MGRKFFHKDNSEIWCGLIAGCIIIGASLFGILLLDDGFIWRGSYIPMWVNWILLPLGIGFTAFSIYSLACGKGATYTDEDFAEAEAEMDALYLRKYGKLPEKPKPEMTESKTFEPEIAEPVKPQKGTE